MSAGRAVDTPWLRSPWAPVDFSIERPGSHMDLSKIDPDELQSVIDLAASIRKEAEAEADLELAVLVGLEDDRYAAARVAAAQANAEAARLEAAEAQRAAARAEQQRRREFPTTAEAIADWQAKFGAHETPGCRGAVPAVVPASTDLSTPAAEDDRITQAREYARGHGIT